MMAPAFLSEYSAELRTFIVSKVYLPARCSVMMRLSRLCGPLVRISTLRKGYSASKAVVNWRRSSRFIGAYQTTLRSLFASRTRAAWRSAGARRLICARVSSGAAASRFRWKNSAAGMASSHKEARRRRGMTALPLNRPIETKGFAREPGNRRRLIVEMGGERPADEQVQSLQLHFLYHLAFDVGVAAGDDRRLHLYGLESLQPEGGEFVLDGAAGKFAALVHGAELLLGANVDDVFAAFLDHLAAG